MEAMVEVKGVRSLFNLDAEHRFKLQDLSNLYGQSYVYVFILQ